MFLLNGKPTTIQENDRIIFDLAQGQMTIKRKGKSILLNTADKGEAALTLKEFQDLELCTHTAKLMANAAGFEPHYVVHPTLLIWEMTTRPTP